MGSGMATPQKAKHNNYYMIQQFHLWIYTQKKLNRNSNKYLYTSVHSSIIHSSQEVGTTQVSTDRWMNKQNWYIHMWNVIQPLKGMK